MRLSNHGAPVRILFVRLLRNDTKRLEVLPWNVDDHGNVDRKALVGALTPSTRK